MRLDKRVSGHWSNYECYLLKNENVHVGWIEWIRLHAWNKLHVMQAVAFVVFVDFLRIFNRVIIHHNQGVHFNAFIEHCVSRLDDIFPA